MTAVSSAKTAATSRQVSRSTTFFHALAFVLGFALVFTLLGSAAGLLGQSLNAYLPIVQKIGAILLVIFALITLGAFQWLIRQIRARYDLRSNPAAAGLVDVLSALNNLLYTERRVTEMHKVGRKWGYLSSALMGISFSAGWVPCVGPILASILFLASDSATAVQGALLLLVYSLGLGIPFLLTGAAFSRASTLLRRLNRHAGVVSKVSGIFLLLVAWLLWSDRLAALTTTFAFLNEWVFAIEEGVTSNIGMVNALDPNLVNAMPLALMAGIISFISPCVLPLIPAYIGYLSGATLSNSR